MCLLRKKLLLFDYTIGKLVEWQKQEKEREGDAMFSTQKCLEGLTGVRLMKLLYFICLKSVKEEVENIEDTLFGIFKNYLAYEHGPVEVDAYNNRSSLLRYKFEDRTLKESHEYRNSFEYEFNLNQEEFYRLNNNADKALDELIEKEKITRYKKMIDESILSLQKSGNYLNGQSFILTETEDLVSLSHDLKLWDEANKSNGKLSVDNIFSLKEEVRLFITKLVP